MRLQVCGVRVPASHLAVKHLTLVHEQVMPRNCLLQNPPLACWCDV